MTLQTSLALAWHYLHLKAICFAVWTAFHPAAAKAPLADQVADAIVTAVMADAAPLQDDDHETALAARWSVEESWLQPHATGDGGKAHGFFQLHSRAGLGTASVQAANWIAMLHEGARSCPESPAAPLSGGCHRARKLADRRTLAAYKVLDQLDYDEAASLAEVSNRGGADSNL